jgi:hypothetical protein
MSAGRERTALARSSAQASGVYHSVSYGPSEANRLEIFADREGPHPTFLMFHGGWWQEGSIDDGGRYAATLAPLGVTHVAVGYSLAPAATLPTIVAEASAAVTFLIEHAATLGCDVSRIVAGGHSAGAHLAATLVTELAPLHVRSAISGLLLIGGAFVRLWRHCREAAARERVELSSSAGLLAIFMVIVHAMLDFPLQIASLQWLFVAYLALGWSDYHGHQNWERREAEGSQESNQAGLA